jgi:hypothetical protein
MSRARPFTTLEGAKIWFDQSSKATVAQLELLADYEGLDLDDLLDEGLSQKQVLFRLRVLAQPGLIPASVLERRRERERLQGMSPACRICSLDNWECEGRITRHHFVPRWLMLEMDNYQAYATRSSCTIPVCILRHRDLHLRDAAPKSIVPYLRSHERRLAQKMLDELNEEHPRIIALMANGDFHSYEYQLIRDWHQGLLLKDDNEYTLVEHKFDTDAVRVASR